MSIDSEHVGAAAVLADPIGVVVDVVAVAEPGLDPAAITTVVAAVAGGRVKRRRLAQAVLDRPAVLIDGRSPAARVVGDLLLALRQAGATNICAPVCADCGRALRSLQRRGQDWLCAGCSRRPARCCACGQLRQLATRDRRGRPRCARCPDSDGRDPVEVITAQIAGLQPDADREVIAAAVRRAASRPSHRQRLAWTLEDDPALLTGAGHRAPIPAVIRLIDLLCDAGIAAVVRPACPRCRRVVLLSELLEGERVCRNCVARSRVEICVRCGTQREPATRDEQGQAVCPNCLVTDPANLETCRHCGRRRAVATRSTYGPLCANCPPLPIEVCSICQQSAPCGMSRLTGQPWCWRCQQRSAPCAGCGQLSPIRSGTATQPRCEACTTPAFRLDCPTCQKAGEPIRPGQCPQCRLGQRLDQLLGGPDGAIHPALEPLGQALAAAGPPETMLRWLAKDQVAALFEALTADAGNLTHEALDALAPGPTLNHLRSVLVAVGTLPPRDEHLARLERGLHDLLASRNDRGQRQLLHSYAIWHLLHGLRRRTRGADTTVEQCAVVRQRVRAAVVFLDWIADHDLTLATCRQADLDRWLSADDRSQRRRAGDFVRWAAKQRLTELSFPATRWQGPTRAADDQARWDAARRLLHDDTINPRDRLVGLLVLLYAQHTARIARLTIDQVEDDGGTVRLHLGATPILLPDPVAELTRQIVADHRGHATIGTAQPSPWLFPGGQPGRPINASHLGQRLKTLGIQPGQARSTALFQLATELPAALLARMLGIHITVAVAWQHASAGDWTGYAAEVARRANDKAP